MHACAGLYRKYGHRANCASHPHALLLLFAASSSYCDATVICPSRAEEDILLLPPRNTPTHPPTHPHALLLALLHWVRLVSAGIYYPASPVDLWAPLVIGTRNTTPAVYFATSLSNPCNPLTCPALPSRRSPPLPSPPLPSSPPFSTRAQVSMSSASLARPPHHGLIVRQRHGPDQCLHRPPRHRTDAAHDAEVNERHTPVRQHQQVACGAGWWRWWWWWWRCGGGGSGGRVVEWGGGQESTPSKPQG